MSAVHSSDDAHDGYDENGAETGYEVPCLRLAHRETDSNGQSINARGHRTKNDILEATELQGLFFLIDNGFQQHGAADIKQEEKAYPFRDMLDKAYEYVAEQPACDDESCLHEAERKRYGRDLLP